MGKIKRLSNDTISKIAAGEVVERPCFAIKELIENSIDAKSSYIKIQIEESGLKKIAISDDGEGMDEEDLSLAVLPHTTSKLDNENLISIKNLGFRGEALASITAISKLSIISRTLGSPTGFQIKSEFGEVQPIMPCGAPEGTTIIIENLFSNVPARKKFLKTLKTEYRQILEVVTNFALSFPNIRFEFYHNKKLIFDLYQEDGILDRIKFLLGLNIYQNLIPINFEESYLKILGFLTKPQVNLQNNQKQFIFINGRKITSPLISQAVRESYGSLLESKSYPIFILNILIPFELVDVNIHPKKDQVNFYDNQFIFNTIKNAVSKTLLGNNLTFYNINFLNKNNFAVRLTESFAGQLLKDEVLAWQDDQLGVIDLSPDPIQIHNLYLICQTRKGLAIIDQHAAHERILYERFLDSFKKHKNKNGSFRLKESVLANLSFTDKEILEENIDIFNSLGFEIELFGPTVIRISAVPVLFKDRNIEQLILELLADLSEGPISKDLDSKTRKMLSYLACRSAVKAGQKLSKIEIKQMVKQLESFDGVYTCPHGRPVKIEIPLEQFHRMFKRT